MAGLNVTIDAVVADVGLGADEPSGVGCVPFENMGPVGEPSEFAGDIGPEGFGFVDGALVEGAVGIERGDVPGREAEIGGGARGEGAGLVKERVDGLRGVGDGHANLREIAERITDCAEGE